MAVLSLEEAYAELEIDPGAEEAQVRQARNILLRVWHPDRHQNDPKLQAAAEKKTTAINEAFKLIERAGFPSLEDMPEFDSKVSFEQALKMRELALRERELAVKERIATKQTTTEWIDARARSLFRTALILGCIVGLVVLLVFAYVVFNGGGVTQSDQAIAGLGIFVAGSVLLAILKIALRRG